MGEVEITAQDERTATLEFLHWAKEYLWDKELSELVSELADDIEAGKHIDKWLKERMMSLSEAKESKHE
jgi:hypothetical protein